MLPTQSVVAHNEINSSTPLLEKRRIIGSLRERTIFVPVNSRAEIPFKNNTINNQIYDFSMFLKEMGNRINDHVERTLDLQENIIDIKIKEIDDTICKQRNEQVRLERQLKKIKKTIISKRHKAIFPTPQNQALNFQ